MASSNEVQIVVTADTANATAQLQGLKTPVDAVAASGTNLKTSLDAASTSTESLGSSSRIQLAPMDAWTKAIDDAQKSTRAAETASVALKAAQLQSVAPTQAVTDKTAGMAASMEEAASSGSSLLNIVGIGLNAAVALGITALVRYVAAAEDMREAQLDINNAIEKLDFGAALSGFNKAADASQNFRDAISRLEDPTEGVGMKLASLWEVGKNLFTDVQGKTLAWAQAMSILWDEVGRGKAILEANASEWQADIAAAKNLATVSTSIDELNEALGRQNDALLGAANSTIRLRQIQDEAYESARQDKIFELQDSDEFFRQLDILSEEMAQREKARGAEIARASEEDDARRIASAKQVADALVAQIDSYEKIADAMSAAALVAARAGEAENTANFARAKSDADYYGGAIQNLEEYQTARRASIEREAQIEIDRMQTRYDFERQKQEERRDALPLYSNAWQIEDQKLQAMEIQHNADSVSLSGKLAVSRIQDETKAADEQANQNRRMIEADQQRFSLLTALGQTSLVEQTNNLATVAQRYEQNTKDRIAAETNWANSVNALWAGFADAGRNAYNAAQTYAREFMGISNLGLEEAKGLWDTIKSSAAQQADQLARGVVFTDAQRSAIEGIATAQARLTKDGADFNDSTRAWTTTLKENIQGVQPTTDRMVDNFKDMGVALDRLPVIVNSFTGSLTDSGRFFQDATGKWDDALEGAVPDIKAVEEGLGLINTNLDEFSRNFGDAGEKMGKSFIDGLSSVKGDAKAAAASIIDGVLLEIDSGSGRISDHIVRRVIVSLKDVFDQESAAA